MKRLVVACDGTWRNSDNGFDRDSWLPWKTGGHLAVPSNVTRICRALLPTSDNGIEQVVYYQAGLGSAGNWYSFFIGGFLGEGISENIREAYGFLCSNYEEGDEIVLIGFSRGAFTARSIGGLISAVGLLTREGLNSFYCVFKDWENQMNPAYKPAYGTSSWPTTRPKFSDPSYVPQLEKAGLTRSKIPVKAIGIWETCGSLGIPEMTTFFGLVKLFSKERTEYSFVNTEVPSNVEYAYQALALDERRKPFDCTLWESPKPGTSTSLKALRQTWFPGVHSGVGGGYPDTSIADVTLAWMITQLSEHLTFDPKYILRQQAQNVQYYKDNNAPVAPWASGLIFRNDTGFSNTLTGRIVRTPGEYYVIDPRTGKNTKARLTDTCEFMHPAIRYRIQSKGPGIAESQTTAAKDNYDPMALKGWAYVPPNQPWRNDKALGIGPEAAKWDGYGKWMVKRKDGSVTYIVEEKMKAGTDEMNLLQA